MQMQAKLKVFLDTCVIMLYYCRLNYILYLSVVCMVWSEGTTSSMIALNEPTRRRANWAHFK